MHKKLSQDSSKFKIRCTKLREQLPLSHINSKQDIKKTTGFSLHLELRYQKLAHSIAATTAYKMSVDNVVVEKCDLSIMEKVRIQ
jgi:hypothetical protein